MSQRIDLPQMKSIWIAEDEEAEKLYCVQAQQIMGLDSDDEIGITLINSDRPALNNKKNIELPPLKNRSSNVHFLDISIPSTKKMGKKKSFMKLFRSNQSSDKKDRSISTPFDFHHISHAGTPIEEPEEPERMEQLDDDPRQFHVLQKLDSAFVTESISDASSSRRPISGSSSIYTASTTKTDRIMSTSTMATTILERTPSVFNKLKHQNHPSNELSLEYLKDYTFPTILENKPSNDFTRLKTASIPNSLTTPELEECLFSDNFSGKRISVDDILKYYNTSSNSSPYI
ncbi:hypothetical protein KAFR_0D04540 [Kazachstania africana CBS 2517]|uniref:CRIB domain-containing protein n=1 Tax=Kazachstania africana (strain ATCC 22294 / BCRC 22015 / CBS 2517 / CECT 1963 / NBRC 1671 / NRRL Y-8276) TaxID=1071382 RepID=H2AUQ2_KAZAF|nr:hypothetical protein KAFR_0D04540 [Kazachstania africana CBS 2517]CCF58102.1 hypothetical protein KAFR_0D04540 [Kazachstania africana CBS 2517]